MGSPHVLGGTMRRPSALLAALTGVLVAGPLASVGHAEAGTTLSDLVTTEAGHVTGTVTTSAPYVRLVLRSSQGSVAHSVSAVPADTGAYDFDLETWGFPDETTLDVFQCASASATGCGSIPAVSRTFTPVDVVPSVTWSDIDHLGQENGPFQVTVSDPSGGGTLHPFGRPEGSTDRLLPPLAPGVTTDLDLADGDWSLSIVRCAQGGSICRDYPSTTTHVAVNRVVTANVSIWSGAVAPDQTTAPDAEAHISFVGSAGAEVSVSLTLRDASSGTPLPGGPTFESVLTPVDYRASLPIDLTGVPSGRYILAGTVSYDDPDFGHLEGTVTPLDDFEVDLDAPVIDQVAVSDPTVYPVRDGYLDSLAFTAKVSGDPLTTRFEIRDSAGSTVRVLSTRDARKSVVNWGGRRANRELVEPGAYTVTAVSSDDLDNTATSEPVAFQVSWKQLHSHTFTRTVSAKASFADKYVGRCSTLSFPADGGPKGSMGLYAGTKCHGGARATFLSTVHTMTLPEAFRYDTFQVSVKGGAAAAAPRSWAYLEYYDMKDGWSHRERLYSPMTMHEGPEVKASRVVYPDRSVAWGLFTGDSARYDIREFTVHVTYTTLD